MYCIRGVVQLQITEAEQLLGYDWVRLKYGSLNSLTKLQMCIKWQWGIQYSKSSCHQDKMLHSSLAFRLKDTVQLRLHMSSLNQPMACIWLLATNNKSNLLLTVNILIYTRLKRKQNLMDQSTLQPWLAVYRSSFCAESAYPPGRTIDEEVCIWYWHDQHITIPNVPNVGLLFQSSTTGNCQNHIGPKKMESSIVLKRFSKSGDGEV